MGAGKKIFRFGAGLSEADVDSELDRVGKGHARLKSCVRGVDQAEEFVGDIKIYSVGNLPDESRAYGKGGIICLFELIGGLGVIDLGDLELAIGEAEASREIGFPATLTRPPKDGRKNNGNLNISTSQTEASITNHFGSSIESEGAVSVEIIEAVVENASGKFDSQPVGEIKARGDIKTNPGVDGDGGVGQSA